MVERAIKHVVPFNCPLGYDDCLCCMHSNGYVEDGFVFCHYEEAEDND